MISIPLVFVLLGALSSTLALVWPARERIKSIRVGRHGASIEFFHSPTHAWADTTTEPVAIGTNDEER
jgi:hypothetical protein